CGHEACRTPRTPDPRPRRRAGRARARRASAPAEGSRVELTRRAHDVPVVITSARAIGERATRALPVRPPDPPQMDELHGDEGRDHEQQYVRAHAGIIDEGNPKPMGRTDYSRRPWTQARKGTSCP